MDDKGKLLNPKTGALESNQTNDHGKLPNLSAAYKMGTIEIDGGSNEIILSSEEHPSLSGKNLGRAIYTIVPVKRALGYLLDKNEDGKYAEVEFPKLQADGSMDSSQVFEITLKGKKAKGKGDVKLFVKKGEKGEPLEGMRFDIRRIKTPMEIGDDNRVSQWETTPFDQADFLGAFESGPDGKVVIPEGQALLEGCYQIEEVNAKEKGYMPETFAFSYIAEAENRMMIDFNGEELGNERRFYVDFDSPGKVEDGSVISLYNYELGEVKKEIVGNDGSIGMTNTISPNEKFFYRMSAKLPAYYNRSPNFSISFWDRFDPVLIHGFDPNLSSVGGSDLSKEISVWYQKPNGEIFEMERNKHYFVHYSLSRLFILELMNDMVKQLAEDAHGIPKTKKYPTYNNYSLTQTNKQEETGRIFLQIPIMVDGKRVTDGHFDSTRNMIGIGNKLEIKFQKENKTISPSQNHLLQEESIFSKRPVTKPIRVEIKIMKKDKDGSVLPNAEFAIYDINDNTKTPLKQYDRDEQYTVKSDSQGQITAEKLPYRLGGYYLKEIKAPQGYRLPKALFHFENKIQLPIVGNIGDAGQYDLKLGSHSDADQILNVKKNEDIVNTGTMGTVASLLGGGLILGIGLFMRRKKKVS